MFFSAPDGPEMKQFALALANEMTTLETVGNTLRCKCAEEAINLVRLDLREYRTNGWRLMVWKSLVKAVGSTLFLYRRVPHSVHQAHSYASFTQGMSSSEEFVPSGRIIRSDGTLMDYPGVSPEPEPTIEEPLFTAFEVATLGQALTQHLGALTPADTPEWRVSEADWQRFWRVQQRVMVLIAKVIAKVIANGPKE